MRQRSKQCAVKRNICHFLLKGMISVSQIQSNNHSDSLSSVSLLIHKKENRGDLKKVSLAFLLFFFFPQPSLVSHVSHWKMENVCWHLHLTGLQIFYRRSVYFPIDLSNVINFFSGFFCWFFGLFFFFLAHYREERKVCRLLPWMVEATCNTYTDKIIAFRS